MVAQTNNQTLPTTSTPESKYSVESDPLTPTSTSFPIVGIGASAGGLAAFEHFFSAIPADKDMNMAFLVVQHLAPDHKSMLTTLVQRFTDMPVVEVVDGMLIEPNCVYIIPPDHDMAVINGSLQLLVPAAARGHRFPIDFLFQSLAQELNEKAICIILSGTGSDGTLGMKAIKERGGMAMVQSIESSEFSGMPKSAIDTHLVDYVLTPEKMPSRLLAYIEQFFDRYYVAVVKNQQRTQNVLVKLFALLRAHTGHDFSQYKQSTVRRRIERRMAVHRISELAGYVEYLQQVPLEIDVLFGDLLIGVTKFFRDSSSFSELEKIIKSDLFTNKRPGSNIRVWVCGCSTGEEAYSVAILLQEAIDSITDDKTQGAYTFQLFASDIDKYAIEQARQGFFPQSIASDITSERLAKHFDFDTQTKTYRIKKQIRDAIIFSEHDVNKDPPFSKLDLVSCRNLLIYMEQTLQKKIISLFHYALNQKGFLFLGSSETIGEMNSLFSSLNRKQKLYQRVDNAHMVRPTTSPEPLPHVVPTDSGMQKSMPQNVTLQNLAEKALLQQVVQAGILIDQKGDILYLHGRAGRYLEPVTGGSDAYNILKMAREGLQSELMVTLHKAVSANITVRRTGLQVKTNGNFSTVNLSISPVANEDFAKTSSTLFMVVLEEAAQIPVTLPKEHDVNHSLVYDARIVGLENALRDKDIFIQSANEEQQSNVEELKSSNEELQSINEELQSTNEELETSKEEIQSINEELATTNAELQSKALESIQLNNDLNNLIIGTGIATIFVDMELNILRFTPALTNIISLIKSDVGRPLMHFTSTLSDYDQLRNDLESMLQSLVPKEIEVQTNDNNHYILRMLPYRTTDNRIDGAVINFINVTDRKQSDIALKKANDQLRLATVVQDANDAILLQDLNGNIMAFNRAAENLYGWTESQALSLNITRLIPKKLKQEELSRIKRLSEKEILQAYQTQRLAKNGSVIDVWLTATVLIDEAGHVYAISTTERQFNSQK